MVGAWVSRWLNLCGFFAGDGFYFGEQVSEFAVVDLYSVVQVDGYASVGVVGRRIFAVLPIVLAVCLFLFVCGCVRW